MIFTKETHNLIFQDKYIIIGCAMRGLHRQIYLLTEDDDEKVNNGYLPEYRFVYTYNDQENPRKRYFSTGRTHLNSPKISYNINGNELIGVDIVGNLYSHSAGDREEENLSRELKGSDYGVVYNNVRTIGQSMYAVGTPYVIYKRNGVNDWEKISESVPLPKVYIDGTQTGDEDFGWEDLDCFSEQDMYLVGGKGDVWHFDGENFKQLDFPSNELIENVCCADDGNVYIGGRRGRLWRGKDDTWELISDEEFSVRWKDIEWFDNRLFLGSAYGLWELKDNEIIRAEIPLDVQSCVGSLSICPEKKLLLSSSSSGASMYDGKEWTVLFDRFDLPD